MYTTWPAAVNGEAPGDPDDGDRPGPVVVHRRAERDAPRCGGTYNRSDDPPASQCKPVPVRGGGSCRRLMRRYPVVIAGGQRRQDGARAPRMTGSSHSSTRWERQKPLRRPGRTPRAAGLNPRPCHVRTNELIQQTSARRGDTPVTSGVGG